MRDFPPNSPGPIGYFVHHQGRGHAMRCASLIHALPDDRPVTVFCARDDIFPDLPARTRLIRLPSLFEPSGGEARGMDRFPTPDTLHCAPLGWPGIRQAMAMLTAWFAEESPALFVTDVSAEIAQLCRISSIPHVCVLQHGDRTDPGHQTAYQGAVGLLAPFHAKLAQPDWDADMLSKTKFAPGLGVTTGLPTREVARAKLGLGMNDEIVLVLSGGGGNGMTQAPLGVGARTLQAARWITIGHVERNWHATEPGNLEHHGWVDNPSDYIAAADLIVSSTGNTTTQQILAVGRPWIAVPEWRYFDEQIEKARALERAGAALHLHHLPSSAHAWRSAVALAYQSHDADRQRRLVSRNPEADAALWLEDLVGSLWSDLPTVPRSERVSP